MGNEYNTVDADFHRKAGFSSQTPDVCTVSYALFSVVTSVLGTFGEHSEAFLSGKHYTLLNHVFISD